MERLIVFLLSLCAFSQLSTAVPPVRTDLNPFQDAETVSGDVFPLYRLPNNVIPIHYDLEIRPILDPGSPESFTAPGKVTILVRCLESTTTIKLHSLQTQIGLVNVTSAADGTTIPISSPLEYNATEQTVAIKLGSPGLEKDNEYNIYIEFIAPIQQTEFYGLYLTSYIEPETGEQIFLCTTHMEPDDARRIFPMFDEPAMKASWTVSIIRKANHKSLANHEKDGESQEIEPGWFRDTYKTVENLSSYLLAFAVSDYESESAHPSHFPGRPVTVWGPPPLIRENGAQYAANLSAKFLDFYEKTFELQYSMPKMEEISFADFPIGAMENLAINTYRESRLMYIDGISTIDDKVRMTNTISHELSHQWFGNLITMRWWNDVWLKEGFATYLAPLAVHHVYPEYFAKDALLVNSIQPAMQFDSSPTSNPISPDPELIETETEISNLIGTIVYHKGASVIRMMNAFLTGDIMMTGLKKYLKDFANVTNVQDDLFTVLQEVADTDKLPLGVTVNTIMETWTKQPGYPIVTVNRVDDINVTFSQKKFGSEDESVWWIPLTFVQAGYTNTNPIDTSTKLWFGTKETTSEANVPLTDWILMNPTQIGNYRVVYDQTNFDLLVEQIQANDSWIDSLSKSAILDDYFSLAFAGYPDVELSQALDFTNFLPNEGHFVPWTTFLTHQAKTYRMLGRSALFVDYRKYILRLAKPAILRIGFEEQVTDTPGGQIQLRTKLVEWTCNLGDEDCVAFAKTEFSAWMATSDPTKNNKIQPDLRPTIYCTAIAHGGDAEWDFIVARYKDAQNATSSKYLPEVARNSFVRALGCAKQSYRLAKLLDIALDQSSFLLPVHRLTAIQTVAGNSAGVDLTFNFLRNNFETIVRRFGVSVVLDSVRTLSNYLNNQLSKDDLQTFADSKEELKNHASINGSIALIQSNIDWVSNFQPKLAEWLKK